MSSNNIYEGDERKSNSDLMASGTKQKGGVNAN